jgi:SAM-dependent methyltransferase
VDLARPNVARVYDYVLGGANNFEADRQFAKRLLTTLPDARFLAQENRAFLRRTVSYLAGTAGVRQFVDLGSGIPTVGNTHEVAHRIAPDAKVVYVDHEPVAVAHSELILAEERNAAVVRADIRDPRAVLTHPVTRRMIDFDEPVAILAYAVLHFLPDELEPHRLLARYRDATVPGSYLVLSHLTQDSRPEIADVVREYRTADNPVTERNKAEVTRFFAGYELVDPGVVIIREWRPEIELSDVGASPAYGGVGLRI